MAIKFLNNQAITGNLTVSGNQYFNGAFIEGDGKEMFKYSDAWLRINEDNDFSSGIYCGTGVLRTDGAFQVGSGGDRFLVTSVGAVTAEGTLTLDNGQIVLGGTGRIQGVDTVSANTDAANKLYVDNAIAGVPQGDITGVTAGTFLTGGGTSGTVTLNADTSKLAHIIDSANAGVAAGWMTVAQASASRKAGEIYVTDGDSGDHSFIRIDWMRSYQDSNFTVLNCGGHANRIQGVRVLQETADPTYGPKYLQVKVTATSNYYVIITAPGTIPNYGDLTAVTPVLENTKTGYSVTGAQLEDLQNSSVGTDEGITVGGALYVNGTGDSSFVGDVGIGTDSPDYPLDVSGLTRSSSGFSADGNARMVNWEGSNTGNISPLKLIATYSNVAQGDRIKIEAVGNVGYSAGVDTVVSTIALQMNNNNLLEGSWWQEGGDHPAFGTTGGASVFVRTVATGTYEIYVRTQTSSAFAFTASCSSGTIVPSWTTIQSSIPNTNDIDNKWSLNQAIYENNGDVGIGTDDPKAKLDVNNVFCVDSKEHTITNAFTTCLTVNLANHTGCHVVITAFGDWGGHSSAAYRGEFFLQNGANIYNEPGIILRQDDNTSDGTDQIICQIVDPTSTANPKDFQIQIRHTDTTSPASFNAQLTYTVQGIFNSIT